MNVIQETRVILLTLCNPFTEASARTTCRACDHAVYHIYVCLRQRLPDNLYRERRFRVGWRPWSVFSVVITCGTAVQSSSDELSYGRSPSSRPARGGTRPACYAGSDWGHHVRPARTEGSQVKAALHRAAVVSQGLRQATAERDLGTIAPRRADSDGTTGRPRTVGRSDSRAELVPRR